MAAKDDAAILNYIWNIINFFQVLYTQLSYYQEKNKYKQISTIYQKKYLTFFWLLIGRCSRSFLSPLN